jgi:hypothetical protein
MLNVFRPSFDEVNDKWISKRYLSFLLHFKVSGDRSSFAKPSFLVIPRNYPTSNLDGIASDSINLLKNEFAAGPSLCHREGVSSLISKEKYHGYCYPNNEDSHW